MCPSESDLAELLQGCRQEEAGDLFEITRDQYVANRKANARGTANPSLMNNPFWLSQVCPGGLCAWDARMVFGNAEDPFADSDGPVWCFRRLGATRTELPDGRIVYIGGEHEDGYDPDFCIYNGKCSTDQHFCHPFPDRTGLADVVVFDAPRTSDPPPLLTPDAIKIYGYPVDIFPPTDFHTSTFYADPTTGKESIFIIGGLGYADQVSRDRTDVYRLNLNDFGIHRVATFGAGPMGGTHHHKAELLSEDAQLAIRITRKTEKSTVSSGTPGGEELVMPGENEAFTLRLQDMMWI